MWQQSQYPGAVKRNNKHTNTQFNESVSSTSGRWGSILYTDAKEYACPKYHIQPYYTAVSLSKFGFIIFETEQKQKKLYQIVNFFATLRI